MALPFPLVMLPLSERTKMKEKAVQSSSCQLAAVGTNMPIKPSAQGAETCKVLLPGDTLPFNELLRPNVKH